MSQLVAGGPEHATALEAIHAACFRLTQRWDAASLAALVRQPGAITLIDPEGGFVLARVAADEAEILTLAVLPGLRRQGRGRGLLRAVMGRSGAAGARAMFLEVAEQNAGALALYAAEGFCPVGRRPHYYTGCGAALVLRRALDAAGATEEGSSP